jgi:hypothetical protein
LKGERRELVVGFAVRSFDPVVVGREAQRARYAEMAFDGIADELAIRGRHPHRRGVERSHVQHDADDL